MKTLHKLALALAPILALSACGGGGDVADRVDLANPAVRFVHASPIAPNVTLYREATAQNEATNVPYEFASNYYDIDNGVANWNVKTAVGGVTVGTQSIDPVRGNKYTIVELAANATDNTSYLIVDPYNKAIGSTSARLRLMNASYNTPSVDLYMTANPADINAAGATPTIAATAFKNAGPASGGDSVDIPGNNWIVTVTAAGTKTVLFRGQVSFDQNKDVLLVTVPTADPAAPIKVLVKIEGTPGATEVAPI